MEKEIYFKKNKTCKQELAHQALDLADILLNFMIFLGSQQCSPHSSHHSVPYDQDKHFGADYREWESPTECCIREDIYNNGPVTAVFTVYSDFPERRIHQGVNVDWVYKHGNE